MPSSRKRLLASVLGYALMAAGTGLAGEIPHQRSIALIDKACRGSCGNSVLVIIGNSTHSRGATT